MIVAVVLAAFHGGPSDVGDLHDGLCHLYRSVAAHGKRQVFGCVSRNNFLEQCEERRKRKERR